MAALDQPRPLPLDYDRNPDRFRTGRAVVEEFGLAGDVHAPLAARLRREASGPILDMGCGDGVLGRLLSETELRWIGVDLSRRLLRDAPRPVVLGDAACLPFRSSSFGAVAAVYMLYHLFEPIRAIREAHRVLHSGGLFVAVAPSRRDSPELQGLLPPSPPDTFDAEVGPALIAEVFGDVEVDAWDGPYLRLPDPAALRRYLIGRGVDPSLAAMCAGQRSFPLTITKRGALLFGRKA
jgi:SAM-dependent methyltransferase